MNIQDKFNKANVVYKITKDIDLGGETLTIPESCTLEFQGGSFSNGIIFGNNTNLINLSNQQIFQNCILKGFKVYDWDIQWFGAKEGEDISVILQQWYDDVYLNHIYSTLVINGYYKILNNVKLKFGISIKSTGDSYAHANENSFFSDNSILRIGAILEVSPNITAFSVSSYTPTVLTWSKIGQITLKNIRFVSNDYSSTLFEYLASGNPDKKFYVEGCSFSGFDKCFHFKGAFAPAGSITSGFRIEYSKFTDSNYAIFCKMEQESVNGQAIVPITMNATIISRCAFVGEKDADGNFIKFPKLYLSGLYGQSRIEYSTFSFAAETDPIYCGLYWGNIVFEGNYIENYKGNIRFSRESVYEANAVVEVNSNYGTWSGGAAKYLFENVVIQSIQHDIYDFNAYFKYPNLKSKDLYFRYGEVKWTYIKTSDDDGLQKCCILDVPKNYNSTKHILDNILANGLFKSSDLICLDQTNNILGTSVTYDNPIELSYELIKDNIASGAYVFTLYKGRGNLRIDLYDNDTIIKNIYTNASVGTHIIKLYLDSSITTPKIIVSLLNANISKCFISTITMFRQTILVNNQDYISQYNYLTTGSREFGYKSQRPELVYKGTQYFDISLNKPIWWNGEKWIDATGAEV